MQPDYVGLVNRSTAASDRAKAGVGHLLLHRVTWGAFLRSLASPSPVTIVDPNLYSTSDCDGYGSLHVSYGSPEDHCSKNLHPRFRELMEAGLADDRTALVLATGPSAGELDLDDNQYDVRITCNSAVRNTDLLKVLRPVIIGFADPVFHFGPGR
jgi:hypothetical protein